MKIKELVAGNFSRDVLKRYLLPILVINFYFWLSLSWILYDGYYFWPRSDISFLGGPKRNPLGWIPWSIAMASTGIIQIPIVSHFRKGLDFLKEKSVYIISFFFYGASVGLIGLGVVPQLGGPVFYYMHLTNAILAFGGLILGFWTLALLTRKNDEIQQKMKLPLLVSIILIICFVISQIIRVAMGLPLRPTLWILSFSFWEWLFLFVIFGIVIFILYTVDFEALGKK